MSNAEQCEGERERQLDAIIAEYYCSAEKGEAPDQGHFIARYPDFQQELSEFFADFGMFQQSGRSHSEVPALEPTITDSTWQRKDLVAGAVVRYFGAYEILEELGSGGMGIVYKARHARLRKLVALKMIRTGDFATDFEVKMFQAEARAAAKLDHPGIVPVHEVGMYAGQHFYSMDYVAGGSLSKLHRDEPVAARRAAELVRQMAEAIHYAHGKGIVHRDLKPANVLLTPAGVPRITDFGLAKRMWADQDSVAVHVTATGQVLGTAGYMSPEQAGGKTKLVGPPADVYALGAILYALLTSRAPFVGESQAQIITQVIRNEPVSPRVLNPNVARDLETICLKCLNKEPHGRYGTAQLLAEDLQRFLERLPVLARPISRPSRAWRWCRRNPEIASLSCMILLSLMGGTVVSAFFAWQANNQAVANLALADKERAARQQADEHERRAEANARQADIRTVEAENTAKVARKNMYQAHMNLIEKAWEEGRLKTVNKLLALYLPKEAEDDLRSFEWYFWRQRCQEDLLTIDGLSGSITAVAYSPTRSLVMSADEAHNVKLWDELTGQRMYTLVGHTGSITSVAFSPDGESAASSSRDNTVIIWDINSQKIRHVLSGHTQAIERVVFSSDGEMVASASLDGTARMWRVNTGELKATLSFDSPCRSIAFSRDGRHAAAVHGSTLTIVELNNDLKQRQLQGASRALLDVVFSPDNRTIATAGEDRTIRLWSIDKPGPQKYFSGHTNTVNRISFNGDGSLLASASVDLSTRIWQIPSGLNVATYRGHTDAVSDVAISADSSRIVSASLDGTLKIWDAIQRERVHGVLGSINSVKSVAISSDGEHIAFSNIDGSVQLLRVSDESSRTFRLHSDSVQRVAFHPSEPLLAGASLDGSVHLLTATGDEVPIAVAIGIGPLESIDFSPITRHLVVGSQSGKIALWDIESKQITRARTEHHGSVLDTRFCPTRNMIASGGSDHTVKLWDLDSDTFQTFKGHTDSVTRVAFCPSRNQLASASQDGTAKIWDLDTGDEIMELAGHTAGIHSLIYNPDGSRIATASHDGSVKLWDAASGEETLTLIKERRKAYDLAFTPDGQRLVTPSESGHLHSWDATQEKPVSRSVVRPTPLSNHLVAQQKESVTCILHSRDGRNLVWAGHDHIAHLWDITRQQEVQTYRGHEGPIWTLDFSLDGRTLVTGSEDKSVRFWDLHTGQELHQELTGGIVSCLRFSRDGKTLVVNNWDRRIRVWEMHHEGQPGTLQVFSHDSILAMSDKSKFRYTLTPLGLALPPSGEQFVVGGPSGELWLCNLNNGSRQQSFEGHANKVHSVDISPSGDKILSACHDCTIRRWDTKTGRSDRVFYGHTAIVHEARFLPDGQDFVSVSADGSVRLWNAATGDQLAFGNHGNDVRGLSVAPDGRSCVSVGFDGAVRSWDLPMRR